MVSKSWVFTLNNYRDEDEKFLNNLSCNYLIYGREIGEKGTPHLQGFVTFKGAYKLTGLKKIMGSRYHLEIAIAKEQAVNYCLKDKDYVIVDNRSQGKRTDLEAVAKCIKSHGLQQAIEEHPVAYIKYGTGMTKLACAETCKPRYFKPEIKWIWGRTGVGKTRSVVETEPDLWISGKNLKWWEGYCGQEATLFDDFRKDFCTFHELLRILDRYPMRVEFKGGSVDLCSKRMYITSCYPPDRVYDNRCEEDINQLLRRIDSIVEYPLVTESIDGINQDLTR